MEEKHMRIVVLVLMFLATESPAAAKTDLQETLAAERAALDSLKVRLESDREKLKQAKSRQKVVSRDLERKERDIVRIRGELRRLTRRQGTLAKRLGTARRELVRVDARRKVREYEISRRMREMYKLGRRGTLRILFSAGSFTDAFRRLRYLSRVAAQDHRDFEAIQHDRKRISGVLRLQAVRHERQKTLLNVKRRNEDRLAIHVRRRESELERLRRDSDARAEAVRKRRRPWPRPVSGSGRLSRKPETGASIPHCRDSTFHPTAGDSPGRLLVAWWCTSVDTRILTLRRGRSIEASISRRLPESRFGRSLRVRLPSWTGIRGTASSCCCAMRAGFIHSTGIFPRCT